MPDTPASQGIDLGACEREDLAHLGLVQPFGRLAVLDRDLRPQAGTAAIADLVGLLTPAIIDGLPETPTLVGRAENAEILAHRTDEGIVVEEVHPTELPPQDLDERLPKLLARFDTAEGTNIFRAAQTLAEATRELTRYDRVMVYRFHPDWSGEVIAEARTKTLSPYLGLRYPASDIPPQARALYLRNALRVIGDANEIDIPLTTGGRAPDLSMAVLRGVSRYHIEYLSNMRVRATLTASIVRNGQLWGMLACHHGTRRFPPHELREACLRLARAFVRFLDRHEIEVARETEEIVARLLALAPNEERSGARLLTRLLFSPEGWLSWLDADGLVLAHGDRIAGSGNIPDSATLQALRERMGDVSELEQTLPVPERPDPWAEPVVGVRALHSPGGHWVAAFRRELVHDVIWGGDPNKPAELRPDGRLSPRRSFAAWRQTVRGQPKPWQERDRALLAAIGRLLDQARPFEDPELGKDLAREGELQIETMIAPFVPALLLAVGEDGTSSIRYATPAFLRVFGVAAGELLGRPLPEALAGLGVELDQATPDQRHITVFSPERGRLFLRPRLRTAMLLRDGVRERLDLLTLLDVTRSEQLASALMASAHDSEAARAARNSFLRAISHEFRTPLNAIIGFAELIANDLAGDTETTKAYAGEIVAAGKDLLGILEGLIEVARVQTGKVPLRLEETPILDVLDAVRRRVRQAYRERNVAIDLSVAPPDLRVVTDGGLLRQALTNLVENAIKFSPPNGRVAMRAWREATRCVIAVEDQGPGIPEELRDRMFEPFVQGDPSLVARGAGLGLGLYIARGIAEALGGVLRHENMAVGSRFRLVFPSREDAKA